jgi:hypothetical protein
VRRQTFTAGELVGSGFTVVDPTRIPMKKNTYGNTVWGIKVRCPLCGDEFDSTISKLRSRMACTLQCAAAHKLMGPQGGAQERLRKAAEADAERRLALGPDQIRKKHQEILTQALEAFGSDWRYAEAMALDAVHLREAKAAGERSLIWMKASAEVRFGQG